MAGGKKAHSAEAEAANEIYEVARAEANQEIAELKEKQARIAETYEVAGRIQAMTFIGKVATVANLIQLKRIKESKSYKDLPHVGTWEEFCNYLKLDRRTVDENLQNLNAFGEDFLETCQQFSLGYRDLRKLRQLTHDGTIQVIDDAIEISGERIPLDVEHREDLQAAIEKVIEDQAAIKEELQAQTKAHERVQKDTHKTLVKLQKDLDKFTKAAEAKGLTDDEDAFIQRVDAYKTMAQGALIALEPAEIRSEFPDLTPRMRAALISTAHYLKMQMLALYDTLVAEVGDPTMNPELLEDFSRWEEENGFNRPGEAHQA